MTLPALAVTNLGESAFEKNDFLKLETRNSTAAFEEL